MSYTIDASVFVAASRPAEINHPNSFQFLEQIAQQKVPTSCPTLLLTECAAAIARATDDLERGRAVVETATLAEILARL